MDLRWKTNFRALLAGVSGAGKTFFVKRFLANLPLMCDARFDRILFYYTEWQETYAQLAVGGSTPPAIEFKEGLPEPNDYSNDNSKKKLLILDDLMREAGSCEVILDIFSRGSHHKNISVIFLTQNIFHKGKSMRDISLNSTYIVIFKNPRDSSQCTYLARQLKPQCSRFVVEAYADATRTPHSYLFIDLTQSTPEEFRFRTNIFPDDDVHYAYVQDDKNKKQLRSR